MIKFEVSLLETTYRGTVNTNNKDQKIMGSIKLEDGTVNKKTYSKIVTLIGSKKYTVV